MAKKIRVGRRPRYRNERLCKGNEAERAFYDLMRERKARLATKRGWPDYFVIDEQGRLFVVEVKPDGRKPKPIQDLVLRTLASAGIPTYVWTPYYGFQKIPHTSGVPHIGYLGPNPLDTKD